MRARARAFLQASHFKYEERDIDRDRHAHDELKRRSGKTAIPTIEIDGKLLRAGFSRSYFLYELSKSLEERLGIKGITLQ